MLKTLLSHVKEFKRDSILTPICMLIEVAMEMVIPLMMASIIDKGVEMGDMGHITIPYIASDELVNRLVEG